VARGGMRGFRLGFGVEAGGGAGDLFLERAGAQQALGDTGEDRGEVAGAEGAREVGGVVGDDALAKRVGELLAVVDELADEREQAAGDGSNGEVAPEAAIRTVTLGPVSCVERRYRGSNLPAVAPQSRKHSRRSICGRDDVLVHAKQVSRIVEALNLRQPTVI
jgi:hypothetical protein